MNEQECQVKGGKLVDGKCEMPNVIPSTSGFKPKKKSNNPFKMWGSYAGATIFVILGLYSPSLLKMDCSVPIACGMFGIQNSIIGSVVGFLIGWLTHYLIRRYRK